MLSRIVFLDGVLRNHFFFRSSVGIQVFGLYKSIGNGGSTDTSLGTTLAYQGELVLLIYLNCFLCSWVQQLGIEPMDGAHARPALYH